jgi:hypothetical protein
MPCRKAKIGFNTSESSHNISVTGWQVKQLGQLKRFEHSGTYYTGYIQEGGTWWHCWLRQCGTSQKVVGLIPDGVTGTFH